MEELLKVVWRLSKTKRHLFYNDSIKTSEDGGRGQCGGKFLGAKYEDSQCGVEWYNDEKEITPT